MTVGIWQRLDQISRNLVPFAVTLLFMLVGMVPLRLPDYSAVAPSLTLIAIYYWAIHRPDLLRPAVAFGIGVLQDLLAGTPLGISSLTFVLAYWLLLTQRRFFLGTSFMLLWSGFAIVVMGSAAVQWLAYSVMSMATINPQPVAFQALLTAMLFPLPAWALMRLQRAFLA